MPTAIGIDLGTTFTCVAYMKTNELVEVVTNKYGNKITPSVVHYGMDNTTVGEKAVEMRGIDTANTIFQVKRFMGRVASDPEIKKRTYPFELFESKKGNARIRVTPCTENAQGEPQILCPEQISSQILHYAKTIAEESLGHEVTHAVITVPANFNNDQREATNYAGTIAGLKVLRIVNEPTAAALAYGFDRKRDDESRVILVYDLGGGTFDVSIVRMKGTEAEVLSTQGLTFLGGEDFDYRIYEEAVSQFKKMGVDIPKHREFTLLQSCELAKRTLSTRESTDIVTFNSKGEKKSIKITQDTFVDLCQDLFEKTIDCVKNSIRESGCSMNAIDDVVLVGGSSRIPRVQELLQKVFGNKKLKFDIPPDHAVAHGAAILAESLSQSTSLPVKSSGGAVKLVDVTPFSLGVEVTEGDNKDCMCFLIRKNTRYPSKKTHMLSNSVDNQTTISFKIREGEKSVASENNLLGKLSMNVQPKPRGKNQMETTFTIDADGILKMFVKDLETGKDAEITVATSTLTQEEITQMANAAKIKFEAEAIQQAKIVARKAFDDALTRAKLWAAKATEKWKQETIEILIKTEEQWFASKDHTNEDLYDHTKSIRKALSKLNTLNK